MRAAFWYLVFVGLPFLGLFAILQIGERIEPPRAVHGRYAIAFDSSGSGACLAALVDSTERSFSVSQSGPQLEIALGSLEFVGAITGDSLRATAALDDKSQLRGTKCQTSSNAQLVAALIHEETNVRLPGEIVFTGCENCPALPFRAVRLSGRGTDANH
jgi:hypothetical protein